MKRTPLNRISPKQHKRLQDLHTLKLRLAQLCENKSELSGKAPDWQSGYRVEPHHIWGRIGKRLLDPFNIIMLIRKEHDYYQDNMTKANKQYLTEFINPIRIKQGFSVASSKEGRKHDNENSIS